MTRLALIAMLMTIGLPVWAAERQLVPASEIVAAAQAMLEAKAGGDKIAATFALVGHVSDVSVAGEGKPVVQVDELKLSWLRPRVGVPVRVTSGDGKTTPITVWFSVVAPAQGDVYASNYPRGTQMSEIHTKVGSIDLARTHGKTAIAMSGFTTEDTSAENNSTATVALRLRRAVASGAAILADDFEPTPAVQAQQSIRIDVGSGVVHLSTKGRALTDGAIGQVISVLPANASQPVRARVVSDQVVTIEN
jgi:flagella basal body P-ring formation protein FlgA